MSAICGASQHEFYIARFYRRKKVALSDRRGSLKLIMAQDWYEPELIMEQKKGESNHAFRKRAEKHLRFKPLGWRMFIRKLKERIQAEIEARDKFSNTKITVL